MRGLKKKHKPDLSNHQLSMKAEGQPKDFFGVQAKLEMGKSGDKYEKEADTIADEVVNQSASIDPVQTKGAEEEEVQQKPISESISKVQKQDMKEEEQVQAKCAECENEDPIQKLEQEEEEAVQTKGEEEDIQAQEEEESLQAKDEEELQTKPDGLSGRQKRVNSIEKPLAQSKGSGRKMEKSVLNEMESGFGADFSQVRIHDDARAYDMNKEIGAQAFTHGGDIYFNAGKYQPESEKGKHLLAHELTHTIQQKGGVQKKVQKYPEHNCTDGEVIRRAQTVVWFERDSTRLRSDENVDSTTHLLLLMREVRSYLNLAQGNGKVIVYGYASEEGSENHNQSLSQQRADRIKELLIASGLPEHQIIAIGKGESLLYENRENNRRVEVKYKPPVTCMEFEPLPVEGSTCGAVDCLSSPYLLGSRTPHYGKDDDFKYFDFPSLGTSEWLRVAPFRPMPDGMLEFGMKNVLRGLAGSDGVDMVNHFRGGSGSTWTHGSGSRLSKEATYCPSVNGAVSSIETQLAAQLRVMKTIGMIDCSAFSLAPVPVFHFSFSDSTALKGIIGGTQGMEVYLKGLRLKDQATCTYELDIQLVVFDDFGVDKSDLYWPALIKFWILQHERSGNKPFVNKLLVDRKITI